MRPTDSAYASAIVGRLFYEGAHADSTNSNEGLGYGRKNRRSVGPYGRVSEPSLHAGKILTYTDVSMNMSRVSVQEMSRIGFLSVMICHLKTARDWG
jgi:hypothetical protein